MDSIIFAIILTSLAGLSTGIGGAIIVFIKKLNIKVLSAALGLSAGVMIFISFVEIFKEANHFLGLIYGEHLGYIYTLISFFGGMAIIAFIDQLIPSADNPHELNISPSPEKGYNEAEKSKLMRLGAFSAIAIAIHNFPEGIATFAAAAESAEAGIGIAIAVAIHNIPEGIAVAVPIYYATNKKAKAVGHSFLSGLAEPIGGLVGYFLLMRYLGDGALGVILAGVAGIMVYISLDELLPTAEKYGHHHISIIGVVVGMMIMGLTLVAF